MNGTAARDARRRRPRRGSHRQYRHPDGRGTTVPFHPGRDISPTLLRVIARELLKTIRENVSIDWTAKESVRAKLRVMVKRILRKYGYPPDKQEKATQTVLQQAELLCADWAE